MTRGERFSTAAGLLGLVVNIITLTGFIFGFVELSPHIGFWAKPGFISAFSFFFLVLCVILVGLGVIAKLRKGSAYIRRHGLHEEHDKAGPFILFVILVWIPFSALWSFAAIELNKLLPENVGWDAIVFLGFFWVLGSTTCGFAIAFACMTLDRLFAEEEE